MNRIEEEKRDTDFQRAMVERQLEDLRLSVYGTQRMPSPLGTSFGPLPVPWLTSRDLPDSGESASWISPTN